MDDQTKHLEYLEDVIIQLNKQINELRMALKHAVPAVTVDTQALQFDFVDAARYMKRDFARLSNVDDMTIRALVDGQSVGITAQPDGSFTLPSGSSIDRSQLYTQTSRPWSPGYIPLEHMGINPTPTRRRTE